MTLTMNLRQNVTHSVASPLFETPNRGVRLFLTPSAEGNAATASPGTTARATLQLHWDDRNTVDRENDLLSLNGGTPDGLELTNGSGSYVLVVRQKDNSGRLVWFDKSGISGHSIKPSPLEAFRNALADGFITPAAGAFRDFARTEPWLRKMRTKAMLMEIAALNPSPRSVMRSMGLRSDG
ncbi:hypothetical protein [Thauera sp. WH-1]|uniref:hypothetical protein n=1 Tax=Thauera sp. WH-1 TaxID=3398230 RepID=UPI0039FBDE80